MNIKHILKRTLATQEGKSSLTFFALALIACAICAAFADAGKTVMYLSFGFSLAAMVCCNTFIKAMMNVYYSEEK